MCTFQQSTQTIQFTWANMIWGYHLHFNFIHKKETSEGLLKCIGIKKHVLYYSFKHSFIWLSTLSSFGAPGILWWCGKTNNLPSLLANKCAKNAVTHRSFSTFFQSNQRWHWYWIASIIQPDENSIIWTFLHLCDLQCSREIMHTPSCMAIFQKLTGMQLMMMRWSFWPLGVNPVIKVCLICKDISFMQLLDWFSWMKRKF